MPRRAYTYHYLYKTTNLINEKFYVGMHSTDNLEDGYLGSGKYLRNSINKYGRDNFKHEILEFFKNRKDLVFKEENYVNANFIKDPLCMNIKKGGIGGLVDAQHFINWNGGTGQLGRNKQKWLYENDPIFKKKKNDISIKNLSGRTWNDNCPSGAFKGKKHTSETKFKMRKKASERIGEKNSQFGTCWIRKFGANKKIKKDDLAFYLLNGWIKGRKIG